MSNNSINESNYYKLIISLINNLLYFYHFKITIDYDCKPEHLPTSFIMDILTKSLNLRHYTYKGKDVRYNFFIIFHHI